MTPLEAKRIIEALANGIDPETGEILPDQNTLNNPHVIRALFVAAKSLEKTAKRTERDNALPSNAGHSWTESEDTELLANFDAENPIKVIAEKHQRPLGAIAARLVRLGRIKERNEAYSRA